MQITELFEALPYACKVNENQMLPFLLDPNTDDSVEVDFTNSGESIKDLLNLDSFKILIYERLTCNHSFESAD